MKENIKLNFATTKWPLISGFDFIKKDPSCWKKYFLGKKFFLLICVNKTFFPQIKFCAKICFKIIRSWDILDFSDFTVPNIVIQVKTIKNTGTKKDEENFTHSFWDNYLRKLSRQIFARRDEIVEN